MEFSNTTFDQAEKTITLRKIRTSLRDRLARKFPDKTNVETTNLTHEILRVHGLHKDNFDYVKIIEKSISERINDISIDDNSNKSEKTIKGTLNESVSPAFKAVGYDYLFRVLKQIYGKREAKRLSGLMYDFSIGLSDSTNILLPYCWAMDASKLVTVGRTFGQLQSKPSKRISSYISALCETIHQISSHLAGAVAIGTFFLDIAHLGIFKENYTIDQIKTDPDVRKYIENEFQQFIHSVNHLSRMAAESPFTNVSIFDKTKLKELIKPENMGWYFMNEEGEIDEEYCIDYIIEIQNIYLDLFDKGDPLKDGIPYRFPVTTMNFSKEETEDGFKIIHENFLDDFLDKRDVSKYNIFASEGTKVSSCCFKGDEFITIQSPEEVQTTISIKDFVNLYLDKDGETKIHDDVYINSVNEDNEELTKITGVLKKKNHTNKLISITVDDDTIKVTPDHIIKVKDIDSEEVKEICANELINNSDKYLIQKR